MYQKLIFGVKIIFFGKKRNMKFFLEHTDHSGENVFFGGAWTFFLFCVNIRVHIFCCTQNLFWAFLSTMFDKNLGVKNVNNKSVNRGGGLKMDK